MSYANFTTGASEPWSNINKDSEETFSGSAGRTDSPTSAFWSNQNRHKVTPTLMERLYHSHATTPVLPAEGRTAAPSGLKKRFMDNIKTGLKGIAQQEVHRIGPGRKCTSPTRTSSCHRDKVTEQQGKTTRNKQCFIHIYSLSGHFFPPDILLKLLITKKKH